jgi:hypothetical protein
MQGRTIGYKAVQVNGNKLEFRPFTCMADSDRIYHFGNNKIDKSVAGPAAVFPELSDCKKFVTSLAGGEAILKVEYLYSGETLLWYIDKAGTVHKKHLCSCPCGTELTYDFNIVEIIEEG